MLPKSGNHLVDWWDEQERSDENKYADLREMQDDEARHEDDIVGVGDERCQEGDEDND